MRLPEIPINVNRRVVMTRLLPIAGEVLVKRGERVDALEVIARTEIPNRYRVIDVARQLGRSNIDMAQVMHKAEGDQVQANEVIAVGKGGLPFLQRTVRAPVAGHIGAIGSGWVLLETDQSVMKLQAFINGIVARVIADRGVIIESRGAMITAACGFGGEAYGPLKRLVHRNSESLEAEAIDESAKDSIILGGRTVDETVLRAAEAAQVRGIIVGSIDASLLSLDPPVKVRVVATEGFGDVPMSPYTFGILGTSLGGQEVSIRGITPGFSTASPTRATELPVILSTTTRRTGQAGLASSRKDDNKGEVGVGSRVRVTRGRLLGTSGTIDSLPKEPQRTEAGLVVPGAYVKLDGIVHYIPWANLEQVT